MNVYYIIIIINIDLFILEVWHQSDLVFISDSYCIKFMNIIKYYFGLIYDIVIECVSVI